MDAKNVLTKELWDNRRGWSLWGLVISGVAAMYTSFYPMIGKNPEMAKLMDAYPEAIRQALNMQDLTGPTNYLNAVVFGLAVPILFAVFALLAAKGMVAEEESGVLDLVMAHPVGRVSLALQRLGAVLIASALIASLIFLMSLALRGPAELTAVSPGRFAALAVQLALFGGFFVSLVFSVGAATGRRSLAVGSGTGALVFGYLGNGFLPQVKGLEWTRDVSPFHWYLGGDPLKNGLQLGDCALLLGLSALMIGVGVWRFEGRDLDV